MLQIPKEVIDQRLDEINSVLRNNDYAAAIVEVKALSDLLIKTNDVIRDLMLKSKGGLRAKYEAGG